MYSVDIQGNIKNVTINKGLYIKCLQKHNKPLITIQVVINQQT
jgi:hypothetical protein